MRAGRRLFISLSVFLIAGTAFHRGARAGFDTSAGAENTTAAESPSFGDQLRKFSTDHPEIRTGLEILAFMAASKAIRIVRGATAWLIEGELVEGEAFALNRGRNALRILKVPESVLPTDSNIPFAEFPKVSIPNPTGVVIPKVLPMPGLGEYDLLALQAPKSNIAQAGVIHNVSKTGIEKLNTLPPLKAGETGDSGEELLSTSKSSGLGGSELLELREAEKFATALAKCGAVGTGATVADRTIGDRTRPEFGMWVTSLCVGGKALDPLGKEFNDATKTR
jgi:hypothetical protein